MKARTLLPLILVAICFTCARANAGCTIWRLSLDALPQCGGGGGVCYLWGCDDGSSGMDCGCLLSSYKNRLSLPASKTTPLAGQELLAINGRIINLNWAPVIASPSKPKEIKRQTQEPDFKSGV
jgi:hypothetical protein